MIDGLDGLSGLLLLASFGALTFLAVGQGSLLVTELLVFSGCLVAFLSFNLSLFRPQARIFLGDSGSMFLGLALTWYFIKMTQGPDPIMTTVTAGWILGLPLLDTVSVMIGRIWEKRSPFHAGRDHMHHRLRRAEFSVNCTVAVMLLIHSALVIVGVVYAKDQTAQPYLFWLFVSVTLAHFTVSRFWLEPVGKVVAKNLGLVK